ncbi:hypothetical protein D9615_010124 [Tricholomella constricta]|uniref:PX domain-containing protein n=1 Tax=Tricholomella constricta TaxID=117010 RepID=A0A8H5LWM5_9AGAR|nr:hypothetical protein D9615_010124 [Tricholomella constricta]
MFQPVLEGVEDGPVGTDSYKRAVYRQAPSQFSVQMLPPTKISGSYSYGMRITSVSRGDRSSRSSFAEYDIWRRWEDCLSFQGSIEEEYRRMARAKRLRLQRGKGVKRNGFYKQDAASSWESLPPGPDPNSVGRDIHDYIPALTKKGTVFRASQATIDQRATELKAFVHELWKDDVPALIDEIRTDYIVTDFFGYWRRDHELAEKQRKQRASSSRSRSSVTSSVFSMYFSSSNPSIQDFGNCYPESIATSRSASTYRSPRQSSPSSEAPRNRKITTDSNDGSPLPKGRRRAYSTGSSNFSASTPSDSSLDSPVQVTVPVPAIADDVPTITFDHIPQWQANYVHEHPTPALAILPEDREMCLKTDTQHNPPPVTRRRRKSSAGDTNSDRHGMVFVSPPSAPDVPSRIEEALLTLPDCSVRESWQTMDSVSRILEGIDMSMPISPSTEVHSHRASMSSIATFMTDVSTEGVLPRTRNISQPASIPRSLRRKTRVISGPVSISEFDNDWSDPEHDLLDTFLAESFPMPCLDIPHIEVPHILVGPPAPESCPTTPLRSTYSNNTQITPSIPRDPVSPAKSSTFTVSTISSSSDKLTIKAKYNDSLILLRVSNEISFKDLRQRLFNKFVGQEGVPLTDSFKVSFLQPVAKPTAAEPTDSSDSTSSNPDNTILYPVMSEADWENVAACIEGYKLTLHVFDNPS